MEAMQTDFLIDFETALSESNLVEAKTLCENVNNEEIVRENVWEIIPLIAKFLALPVEEEITYCSKIKLLLEVVGDVCSAEDMLLALHKEICSRNSIVFVTFLPALKRAVINLPVGKIKFTIWCFDAINDFIYHLDINYNMDDYELKLLALLEMYIEVLEFYSEVVHFYKNSQIKIILAKYLLKLLGVPLILLDLSENTKGAAVEQKIVHLIALLFNPYKCLKWRNFIPIGDDLEVDLLSLGNLFYLIVARKIGADFLPQVYSHVYIFTNLLRFMNILLNVTDNLVVVEKGLRLGDVMLRLIPPGSLEYLLLEDSEHSRFSISTSMLITYNPSKSLRKRFLEILKQYVLLFEEKGRYLLIYNLFSYINHSGLLGYLITMYKDMLIDEFKKSDTPGKYFKGNNLHNILNRFCQPGNNFETVMDLADRIGPNLNFLIFLAIRDKDNKTNIWDYFQHIHKNYLYHLKKGITHSKNLYNFRIRELDKIGSKGDKMENENSVSVAGEYLPKMSCLEEINVCKSYITALDVLESLLYRLVEFIGHEMH